MKRAATSPAVAAHPPRGSDRAFQTLDLVVRRRLDGLLHGDHAGLRLGPGSDPEEVVRYRPGEDDVRRIDWNVTARSQEPHVWRSHAEHELDTWVLIDATASMDFGSVDAEKRDLAAWTAGVVSLLVDGPGNRVGMVRLGPGGAEFSPPLPGRVAAYRAMRSSETLPRVPPRSAAGRHPAESTAHPSPSLSHALNLMLRRERRPGMRVVISDFVEPDGNTTRPFTWEKPLRHLAARHDVIVIEIVDPRELELPDVGYVLLTDPETGRSQEVWTGPALRQRYAHEAAAHRAAVGEAVHAAAAGHVVLRTDTDWLSTLARFVLARRRMPAGPPRRVRR